MGGLETRLRKLEEQAGAVNGVLEMPAVDDLLRRHADASSLSPERKAEIDVVTARWLRHEIGVEEYLALFARKQQEDGTWR